MRDDKLTPEEARNFSEIMNNYLAVETADYNLKNRVLAEQGDVLGVTKVVDEYVEYLKLLEEHLELGLIGLRKTILRLTNNSSKFKRRHLERLFEKET